MIFWEHIKGLNQLAGANAWTYINLTQVIQGNNKIEDNPRIGFGVNGYNASNNYILTSDMTDGYINNAFTFHAAAMFTATGAKTLTISSNSTNSVLTSNGSIDINTPSGNCAFWLGEGKVFQIAQNESTHFQLSTTGDIGMASNTATVVDKLLKTNKMVVTSGNGFDGSCHAVYFNATSDYRAKKDFKPLQIDALKLIKSIQPYTFKYKDSNLPSIGIIAQDVQNIDLEGFKLVDNENATGENMDYMTIHESKLIYILWKAIQEQQKEIEELKLQLNK